MIKSSSFKNISLLIRFFFSNSLNGLLNRPLLKKNFIRVGILIALIGSYLAFFFYNMNELISIIPDTNVIEAEKLLLSQKITFFSFLSNIVVIGIISYIFVNTTLALDKTSLFFAKQLPFTKNEVKFAYLIFKFSIMLLFLVAVMIVGTFAIQLVITKPVAYITFFILLHLLFVVVIISCELVHFFIEFLPDTMHSVITSLVDCLLILLAMLYFYSFRFSLEVSLASTSLSIAKLIYSGMIIMIILLIILTWLLYVVHSSDRITNKNAYLKLPIIKGPIFRYKSNITLIMLSLFILIIIYIQNGVSITLLNLAVMQSMSGFLLLNYADSTAAFRKQYHLLRIGVIDEWFDQIKMIILLTLPLIILIIFLQSDWLQLVIAMTIALVALTLSYLFQKEKGTLNESSATILMCIIAMIIFSLLKSIYLGSVALIVIAIIHYKVIKEVRNDKTI